MQYGIRYILPYIVLVTYCVMCACYLLFSKRNAFGKGVLPDQRLRREGGWVFAVSTIIYILNVPLLFVKDITTIQMVSVAMDVAVAFPFPYRFMLILLQDRKRWNWRVWVVTALLGGVPLAGWLIWRNPWWPTVLFVALFVESVAFVAIYIRAWMEYRTFLMDNYADLERKEVTWSLIMLGMVIVTVLSYFIQWKQFVNSPSWGMEYFFPTAEIALITFIAWRIDQQLVLSPVPETKVESVQEPERADEGDLIVKRMEVLLKKNCEATGLYRQNELTLAALAMACGTNRSYLGKYFAANGLNYNTYINGLRIEYFKKALLESYTSAPSERPTVAELAEQSGFNSYPTFYRAFRAHTGRTVREWLLDNKLHVEQDASSACGEL